MKILLYNVAYCTGVDGSFGKYAAQGYQHFFPTQSIRDRTTKGIDASIRGHDPTVCCLVEIDSNAELIASMRDRYPFVDVSNKYRSGGLFSKLPFFRKKSHGLLAKIPFDVKRHDFSSGFKRLLIEAEFENGLSLFFAHFSLRSYIRKEQFREVAALVKGRQKVIVCGDFNIFEGATELSPFLDEAGLTLASTESDYTFPSFRPQKMLDVFLHSPDLQISSSRVLNDVVHSDHLPVLLEVDEDPSSLRS